MISERQYGSLLFLPGENRGKYPHCHSLYLKGPGLLIDPASARDRLIRLREEEGVNMVCLSHWHEDHFKHLDLFADVPLWMSQEDAPALGDLEIFLDFYGVNEEERVFWRPLIKEMFNYRPRQVDRFIGGGEIIDLGEEVIEIISSPGHTPGHLSFLFKKSGVLFLGDYDLTPFGPWYGDRASSIEKTISSLRYLRTIEARLWITGHERGIFETNPGPLWESYEGVIYERERKLLAFLAVPRSWDEIIHEWIIYGKPREPKEFFLFGERGHMGKHLERLIGQGLVYQEGDKFHKVDKRNLTD